MTMRFDLIARLEPVCAPVLPSWYERPGSGFPAVVLSLIAPGRDWTHDGPDGLDRPMVQIDVYGLVPTAMIALARAIRDEMEQSPFVDVGGTRFHVGKLENERDMPVEDLGDGKRVFGVQMDFRFFHEAI